jgi:hypothetical protein
MLQHTPETLDDNDLTGLAASRIVQAQLHRDLADGGDMERLPQW